MKLRTNTIVRYGWLISGLIGLLLAAWPTTANADPRPDGLRVVTWNLEWFFDNQTGDNFADLARQQAAPSRADWDWKLAEVARVIAELKPDILALQEIENQRVLFYLTSRLKKEYALPYKIAYIEGEDYFTEQDVGILYRTGLVGVSKHEQSLEMRESKEFYNINKQLVARFEWGPAEDRETLTVFNAHFRAMNNGGVIRQRQARLARHWLQERLDRGENVIVIGDLNSDEHFDQTTDNSEIGILCGRGTPSKEDDLFDTLLKVAQPYQGSHLNGEHYDRILISKSLQVDTPANTDLVFNQIKLRPDLVVRGKEQDKDHRDVYWTIPLDERDVSDHYPLVADFQFKP